MSSDEADWLLWGGSVVQVSGLKEKIALSYSRGTKTVEVDIIIIAATITTMSPCAIDSLLLIISIFHKSDPDIHTSLTDLTRSAYRMMAGQQEHCASVSGVR